MLILWGPKKVPNRRCWSNSSKNTNYCCTSTSTFSTWRNSDALRKLKSRLGRYEIDMQRCSCFRSRKWRIYLMIWRKKCAQLSKVNLNCFTACRVSLFRWSCTTQRNKTQRFEPMWTSWRITRHCRKWKRLSRSLWILISLCPKRHLSRQRCLLWALQRKFSRWQSKMKTWNWKINHLKSGFSNCWRNWMTSTKKILGQKKTQKWPLKLRSWKQKMLIYKSSWTWRWIRTRLWLEWKRCFKRKTSKFKNCGNKWRQKIEIITWSRLN